MIIKTLESWILNLECCFDAFMCNIPCNTNCQQLVLLPITTTGISNCCTGTKDNGLHQNLDTTVKVEACSFLWRLLNGASSRKSLASWCFFTWIFGTVGPIQHAHRQGCMVGFGRHHLCVKTLTSQGKNVLQNKPFIVCCVCGMLFYQVGIYNWGNAFIINLFKSSSRSTSAHYQVWKPSLSSASTSITFLPSLLKGESKKGSWREGKKKKKIPCIHLNYFLSLRSFLLSPVITLHTSHFNTGLSALSERCNLLLVMKTYIPAPLPWKEAPLDDSVSLIEMLLNVHVSINAGGEAFERHKTMVPYVSHSIWE